MTSIPTPPSGTGKGRRQVEAEKLRAEAERQQPSAQQQQQDPPEGPTTAPASDLESGPPVEEGPGPIGAGPYNVKEGECVASIAFRAGHHPDTIWNDAENAELKSAREDPYLLLQGDSLTIPDLRRKDETGATEKRHRFRRKAVPEVFRLRLCKRGEPRAELSYSLMIDGLHFSGKTDADGVLEQFIPPDAKKGTLLIGEGEEYDLQLGALDPVTEHGGVVTRLINLGFLDPEDRDDEETHGEALQGFQARHDLKITGVADEPTRAKLKEVHGC